MLYIINYKIKKINYLFVKQSLKTQSLKVWENFKTNYFAIYFKCNMYRTNTHEYKTLFNTCLLKYEVVQSNPGNPKQKMFDQFGLPELLYFRTVLSEINILWY